MEALETAIEAGQAMRVEIRRSIAGGRDVRLVLNSGESLETCVSVAEAENFKRVALDAGLVVYC